MKFWVHNVPAFLVQKWGIFPEFSLNLRSNSHVASSCPMNFPFERDFQARARCQPCQNDLKRHHFLGILALFAVEFSPRDHEFTFRERFSSSIKSPFPGAHRSQDLHFLIFGVVTHASPLNTRIKYNIWPFLNLKAWERRYLHSSLRRRRNYSS